MLQRYQISTQRYQISTKDQKCEFACLNMHDVRISTKDQKCEFAFLNMHENFINRHNAPYIPGRPGIIATGIKQIEDLFAIVS